ncbi:MAG: hypothetical protein K0R28_6282, partial [Paenibacillus sp.]|nr:hypothetical protein [Paenibacillus sp.]
MISACVKIAEVRRHYQSRTSLMLQECPSMSMHCVERGSVEIYTVQLIQGAAAGSKSYVLTVEAGQIWFDLPRTDEGDFGWLAEVMPDTVLASCRLEQLTDAAELDDRLELQTRGARLLNEWLLNLSSAAISDAAPVQVQQIEPLSEIVVWEPAVFTSEAQVVWVRAEGGLPGLWQDSDLPTVPPGVYVPLMRSVWAASP